MIVNINLSFIVKNIMIKIVLSNVYTRINKKTAQIKVSELLMLDSKYFVIKEIFFYICYSYDSCSTL